MVKRIHTQQRRTGQQTAFLASLSTLVLLFYRTQVAYAATSTYISSHGGTCHTNLRRRVSALCDDPIVCVRTLTDGRSNKNRKPSASSRSRHFMCFAWSFLIDLYDIPPTQHNTTKVTNKHAEICKLVACCHSADDCFAIPSNSNPGTDGRT